MLVNCSQCNTPVNEVFAWGFAKAGFKKIILDTPVCKECAPKYLEPRRILCEFAITYEDQHKVLRIIGSHDNTPKGIENISKSFRLLEIILEKEHTLEVIKN